MIVICSYFFFSFIFILCSHFIIPCATTTRETTFSLFTLSLSLSPLPPAIILSSSLKFCVLSCCCCCCLRLTVFCFVILIFFLSYFFVIVVCCFYCCFGCCSYCPKLKSFDPCYLVAHRQSCRLNVSAVALRDKSFASTVIRTENKIN